MKALKQIQPARKDKRHDTIAINNYRVFNEIRKPVPPPSRAFSDKRRKFKIKGGYSE